MKFGAPNAADKVMAPPRKSLEISADCPY